MFCKTLLQNVREVQAETSEYLRDFALRLSTRAEHLGLSQTEIAERLGLKVPRVSNWFQGRNYPRKEERRKLAQVLGVNLEWLLEGVGEPERKEVVHDEQAPYGLEVRKVPVISWTHAGAAANYEAMPKHWHGQAVTMSRDRKAFALTIEGESMLPDFKPGDRVVCEPSHEPRNGKPVVVKFADDAVQLRIYTKLPGGRIRLASLRPEIYPTIEYSPKDFSWIFPVCELVRTV